MKTKLLLVCNARKEGCKTSRVEKNTDGEESRTKTKKTCRGSAGIKEAQVNNAKGRLNPNPLV